MPPENDHPGTSVAWLKRAKSNLARANQPKTDEIFWEDLCFDCQQAAEKALKAVLFHYRIKFRFVHDLPELITELETREVVLPETVRSAALLSNYAVEARYPGNYEPVTAREFQEAVNLATAVVSWAEEIIQGENGDSARTHSERQD